MTKPNKEIQRRRKLEAEEIKLAARDRKSRTYIDQDGCEVTVMPNGEVFYNVSDWW